MTLVSTKHLDELLSLARRIDRLEIRAVQAWLCDCARHVALEVYAREYPNDSSLREALATLRRRIQTRQGDLELAPAIDAVELAIERSNGAARIAAQVARLSIEFTQRGAHAPEAIAAHAREAFGPADTSPHEQEADWQFRRLLWRLDLLPPGGEVQVRIDQAEFGGALPRELRARARFEELRARVLGGEDVRIELVVEFPEVLFHAELRERA